MESERRITEAKSVVRRLVTRKYRKGHRIHAFAREDNLNRLRALNGLCGECVNLNIRLTHRDGKRVAVLSCTKGINPLVLYTNTPLGESAECPEFQSKG